MKIEQYRTPDAFDLLREEWNSLIDPERSTLLFMEIEWQQSWWENLGRGDLTIIAVREQDGTLIGLAPWFIDVEDGERTVRLIGCTEVSDYLEVIIKPGHEEQVFHALLDFMLSAEAPEWDLFRLCNVAEGTPTAMLLPEISRGCGLNVDIEFEDVCPIVTLPNSYDAYLEGLDKKQRHELRRKRRKAEAYQVDWYIVDETHDLDAEIDQFFVLMAMSTEEKSEFLKVPGHRAFFRAMGKAMFETGRLKMLFLTVDDQPAAAVWQLHYRDRMLLYNSGVDQGQFGYLSPGILLLTYSIEDAIRRDVKYYDFLQGDEEYKFRMGGEAINVYNIVIRR